MQLHETFMNTKSRSIMPRILVKAFIGTNRLNQRGLGKSVPKSALCSNNEFKSKRNDPKILYTVPNAITVLRIAASPGISYLIYCESWNAALAGLCVAGASDWLDGYIARNYNQMSALGSILDPIADKLLVGAVALPLAWMDHLPMWLLGLTLTRDLGLCAGFVWMRSYGVASTPRKKLKHVIEQGMEEIYTPPQDIVEKERMIEVRPSQLSKVNTALQVSLLSLSLAHAGWQVVPEVALTMLTYATAGTTVLSSIDYYINATKVMRIKDLEK